jgi:hypothetical protein
VVRYLMPVICHIFDDLFVAFDYPAWHEKSCNDPVSIQQIKDSRRTHPRPKLTHRYGTWMIGKLWITTKCRRRTIYVEGQCHDTRSTATFTPYRIQGRSFVQRLTISSAIRSAIAITVALMFARTHVGMIEASTTLRPSMPMTLPN